MPAKSPKPFPIQMEVEFLDRLSEPVREGRAGSVSAIIRAALAQYDFANVVVVHPALPAMAESEFFSPSATILTSPLNLRSVTAVSRTSP